MHRAILWGSLLASIACSNTPDGSLRSMARGTSERGGGNSEKAVYDEVPLTFALEGEPEALSLLGSNPVFDYNLTIKCTIYGSHWTKVVSKSQIDQRQVKIPKDGQNCFAFLNTLTVDVGSNITFAPTIPAGNDGSTLFGNYQVNRSETYNPTTVLPAGTASAVVTLATKLSIHSSGASTGFKFVVSTSTPSSANIALPSSNIHWQLPCGQTTPGPDNGNQLRGGGAHQFQPAKDQSVMTLRIGGSLCPPEDRARDIIFVFDVSSSMNRRTRDPYDQDTRNTPNATCGRYQAFNAVLNTVGPNGRFAIVTFGDLPITYSETFFADRNSLEQDLINRFSRDRFGSFKYGKFTYNKIADILCDAMDTDLGTDFTLALNKAVELAPQFRADAQREVYLLTDGRPVGDSLAGTVQAWTLRSTYHARLGTILLNDSGSADDARALLQQLATSPSDAVEATQAGQLASQLQSLTTNSYQSATLSFQVGAGVPDVRSLIAVPTFRDGIWRLEFGTEWGISTGSAATYNIQLDVMERLGPRPPLNGSLTIVPPP